MNLSRHFNLMMASVVSFSIAATPMMGVGVAHAQSAPAAEAPGDSGWQREFEVWRAASKGGTATDYQVYLRSYPNGKFAGVAKTRLDQLNGVKTTDTTVKVETKTADTATADTTVRSADTGEDDAEKKRDLEMWRQVSKTGKQADYEKYLKAFPKGKFAKVAKTRVEGLIAAAKAPVEQKTVAADDQTAAKTDTQDQTQDQTQADDQSQVTAQADQTQDQTADQADAAKQTDQAPASDWEQEYALWKAASDGNTVSEYEAYLKTYPDGKFAAIAQARIVQLAAAEQPAANVDEGDSTKTEQADKNKQDQSADDQNQANATQPDDQNQTNDMSADQGHMADNQTDGQNQQNDMGQNTQGQQKVQYSEGTPDTEDQFLDREGRHEIQGRLTSIGFDTFGSDGSFGPNSRNAIAAWQEKNGAPVSGYLSGDQIAQIRIQSRVSYVQWVNAHPIVVERPVVVVRPRRERVVIEERHPGLDAAIAVGVLGAVLGAQRFGRKGHMGRFNLGGCRKKRRC